MLKLRLSRGGTKKRPVYKLVVADSRFARDGRFIEKVGFFNPLLPKEKKERNKKEEDKSEAPKEEAPKADAAPAAEAPKEEAPKACLLYTSPSPRD